MSEQTVENRSFSQPKPHANRENALKSTGPRSAEGKAVVSRNATKHGFSSRKLTFTSDEERDEFEQLRGSMCEEFSPIGIIENLLVDEIATTYWQQCRAGRWALEELQNRQQAAHSLLAFVRSSGDSSQLPESTETLSGWGCKEIVVKVGSEEDDVPMDLDKVKPRVQIEARLGPSADTLLRYGTTWKRDFYKAIDTLNGVQQSRRAKIKTSEG